MLSDQDQPFIAQWARTVKNEANEVGLIIAIMIGLYIAAGEYPGAAWLHDAVVGMVFAGTVRHSGSLLVGKAGVSPSGKVDFSSANSATEKTGSRPRHP